MRPQDTVIEAEPGEIDQVLRRWSGALVVCNEVSPVVDQLAGAWVRLGEDGEVATSSAAEVDATSRRAGLDAVLGAVEAAGSRLAHLG
jgi:hypothetical protein